MHKPMRLFTAIDAVRMMQTCVLCMWPVACLAATQSLGSALAGVSFLDWMSLITLSFVSGLVALLYRVRKSLEAAATEAALIAAGKTQPIYDQQQRIAWWIFASIHMAGAMFVGVLSFFIGEWLDLNSFLEAAGIALASWSGAKLADNLADGLSDGVVSRARAMFSTQQGKS